MLATLISIPIFGILIVLQSTLVNHMTLLQGTADIILLTVIAWALHQRVKTAWQWSIIAGLVFTFASALPIGVSLIAYLTITAITRFMRRHTWRIPLLTMLVLAFIGTVVMHGFSLTAIKLSGNPIPVMDAIGLITLPSILLNLIFAIPIFAIFNDLANWLYPEEIEV